MNNSIKTLILVIVLLAAGYLLLPYVKVTKNNGGTSGQSQNPSDSSGNSGSDSQGQVTAGNVQTFSSDSFGANFKYAKDQDGDGVDDTTAAESGDKIYVYYSAAPMESGQWVQKFDKDPNVSLADAVKARFLQNVSAQDCYPVDMGQFYSQYGAQPPPSPANTDRVIIAYPTPTDETQPFFQNSDKCPQGYSLTNGLSYFQMDKNHPNKFYFFSIGQYAIAADSGQTAWQDTFTVTK